MRRVFCLESGKSYWFSKRTVLEAMKAMQYFLVWQAKGHDLHIQMCNGRTLAFTHAGKTYAAVMDRNYGYRIGNHRGPDDARELLGTSEEGK